MAGTHSDKELIDLKQEGKVVANSGGGHRWRGTWGSQQGWG